MSPTHWFQIQAKNKFALIWCSKSLQPLSRANKHPLKHSTVYTVIILSFTMSFLWDWHFQNVGSSSTECTICGGHTWNPIKVPHHPICSTPTPPVAAVTAIKKTLAPDSVLQKHYIHIYIWYNRILIFIVMNFMTHCKKLTWRNRQIPAYCYHSRGLKVLQEGYLHYQIQDSETHNFIAMQHYSFVLRRWHHCPKKNFFVKLQSSS